ncbi:aldehyde dehydrogenase family 3 member F1-like [Andrographis paniculata]|uniref:aldehyde dehydrogenase family 3 member F1-like n=1 Tax=Andrographis paniculata TaxID=175694 RepID=UPI0021E90A29|nr:aldehyde dehydrogenase family 3 member F1-like [Andrographis paniculata]
MESQAAVAMVDQLRHTFNSGKTKEESWRRSQLQNLLSLLVEKEDAICDALKNDLGKHPVESFRDEVGPLIKSVNFALKGLKKWMSGKKADLPLAAFPASASLVPEPLGVVLIISSWNFPFGLSVESLIGAIAAGNAAVLKPSELAPASSAVLARLIPSYLDSTAVRVVEGGVSAGEILLQQQWDKIFFTGSPNVARKVMTAAAKNLTPVALELGGKCPAVVDCLTSSWDQQVALKRILSAKFGTCAGQACIAIDYILVEKKFSSTLVELLKNGIKSMFGENPRESNNISRIVNQRHFSRLSNLLDNPTVKNALVYGGSLDEDNLYIEPTLLLDPPINSGVMTEEIFGPLLPIITLEKIEDSVEFIKSMPRALAIYAFTKNEEFKKKLQSGTSSGSIVFNDAIIQYVADTLPFGGVGECGFGRYHGKYSFDAFSHEKAIARRSYIVDFWFRYPPWNEHKLQLFRSAYRFDYLGILLIILGLKRS